MNSKHTPGPWTATSEAIVIASDGYICKVAVHGKGDAEGEANVRLIAAAPDLLAALEELLSVARQPSYYTQAEWLTKHPVARAAVNKAKGAK